MKKCKKILTWLSVATLMISSLSKSVNMQSFISETRLYIEAYMPAVFHHCYKLTAIAVCSCELLIALLLLHPKHTVGASWMAFSMLAFFVYLTGVNLFMPTLFSSIESCGCFGELIHFSPMASFIKSMMLWGISGWLLILNTKSGESAGIKMTICDIYLFLSMLISILPSTYSLLLKRTDDGLYLAGYIMMCMAIVAFAIFRIKEVTIQR